MLSETQSMREKEGKSAMRRNRKDNTKKERIIMIASSVFVLTALTMTGVYLQSEERKSQDDGYTIDFSALENSADDKAKEIAQNKEENGGAPTGGNILGEAVGQISGTEDDLDYLPMEAGSGLVEIPGVTDGKDQDDSRTEESETPTPQETEDRAESEETAGPAEEITEPSVQDVQNEPESLPESQPEADGTAVEEATPAVEQETLHFSESGGLLRPLQGELQVLIPFSMAESVYYETLRHYKRSDAMVIAAPQGAPVAACAEGKVTDIFQDAERGLTVTMDLGDGYQLTYGQLRDVNVAVGSHVNAGDIFAAVEKTTKYYVKEGDNLYLQLTADGEAMDPMSLFQ